MYGLIAIDLRHMDKALCSNIDSPDGLQHELNQQSAIEHAASLTEWYQKEIRSNVVFCAVPLPFVG